MGADDQKATIAAYFGRMARTYDSVPPYRFRVLAQRLAQHAGIGPGAMVLDVATGRGANLFAALDRVGTRGRVVGVDLSQAMVEETGAVLARLGARNAEVRAMDAEHLDFPEETFDHVLCGFALHFFPRPVRALREFLRVLRPGGSAALSTWGPDDDRWAWYEPLLEAYGLPVIRLSTQRFDAPEALHAPLAEAGFAEVRVVEEAFDFVYADEEEWWARLWAHDGPAELGTLTPEAVERFKADAFRAMQPAKEADGFHSVARVLFGRGTRASPGPDV